MKEEEIQEKAEKLTGETMQILFTDMELNKLDEISFKYLAYLHMGYIFGMKENGISLDDSMKIIQETKKMITSINHKEITDKLNKII